MMNKLQKYGIPEEAERSCETAAYSLALIHNIIDTEISSYFRKFNLTPGKFNILMVVKHQGGKKGMSQVDVSKRLIVTPSNMSKMIDKLEKEGLLSRSSLKGDRRVHILKVTQEGSDLLDQVWNGYIKILQKVYGGLNQTKQKTLAALLTEWFENIQEL